MKRFLALLIVFSLFALPLHAGVTGSVSLANSRLSLVDGTAFVDFSAANVLTDHVGKYLRITDAAGKSAWGYIKAAGTGETYSDEILSNPSFDANTTGWTPSAACTIASVAGGQSGNCLEITATGTGSKNTWATAGNLPAGQLYVYSAYHKDGTLTGKNRRLDFFSNVDFYSDTLVSNGSWVKGATKYAVTNRDATFYLSIRLDSADDSGTTLSDTVTLKQVLTPSATGVTITSTPGGTTYNWASIEAGFNYNDAAGYTYTIIPRFVGGGLGMGIMYGF